MSDIIKKIDEVRSVLIEKKERKEREERKKLPGIGECFVCGVFTDSPSNFICDSPQCNKSLVSGIEKLLAGLEATSLEEALEEVKKIKFRIFELLDEI